MTEIQTQGIQMAVDMLTVVAPMVVVFAVGGALIRMALKFIRGRY